jgi:hypothetical protein
VIRIIWFLIAVVIVSATPGISRATSESASSESAESKKFSESVLSTRNPASDLVVSGSVQPRKRYPGGADEDDLQVQAVLPNPSRGLEAHDAAVSEGAASAAGESPASD